MPWIIWKVWLWLTFSNLWRWIRWGQVSLSLIWLVSANSIYVQGYKLQKHIARALQMCSMLPSGPPSTHTTTLPVQCTLPSRYSSGRMLSSTPFSLTSTCYEIHAPMSLNYLGHHQQLGVGWIFILKCVEHTRRFVVWISRFAVWWYIYEMKTSICGCAKIDSQLLTPPLPIKSLYIGTFVASSTSAISSSSMISQSFLASLVHLSLV